MKRKIYYSSKTKNRETLNKQTFTKPQETLEFKLNKPRETLSFTSSIILCPDSNWIVGLTTLSVKTSIFEITDEINNFELYTYSFDEFFFTELKDELEEILDISIISYEDPQDKRIRPRIIKAFIKLKTEKRRTDGYYMFLAFYTRSLFRDFQCYLRIVVGLDDDGIQLILKQYNSNFVTYEISLGI